LHASDLELSVTASVAIPTAETLAPVTPDRRPAGGSTSLTATNPLPGSIVGIKWPLLLLALFALANYRYQLDFALADWLYRSEGMRWALRRDFVASTLLHSFGQTVSWLLFGITLGLALVSSCGSHLSRYQRGLRYVATSMACSVVLITLSKHVIPIPCPWDLQRYGGLLPPGGWLGWQQVASLKGCFPSGHATGGYSLFAWYFFARHYRFRYPSLLLLVASVMGIVFGAAQQVRGAHFLSHDLTTAVVCWVIAYSLAWRMLETRTSIG
jgi:membrane-associated PAP2 superfamily phosphatase